jgi:hypothetical protein
VQTSSHTNRRQEAPGVSEASRSYSSFAPRLSRRQEYFRLLHALWRRVVLCKKRNSLRRKKTQIQGLLLIHQAPKPPAVLQQNYAPGHAHAGPVRQKVLLREIRPRWHPAGALLEHWAVFLRPNGDHFIAFNPLGDPGAAGGTMGCPGALQVEKIRPLGSPIATAALLPAVRGCRSVICYLNYDGMVAALSCSSPDV